MRPDKPRPDFPLFAHRNGQWAKKIRQQTYYFGTWDNPQAAHDAYLDQKEDLQAGREPSKGDGLTVRDLVNHFLTSKKRKLEAGELGERTYQNYYKNCERVLKAFGRTTHVANLRPTDFSRLRADFAKTHGPVALLGDITCTRVLFKYADDNFRIRVNYGQEFDKPSRSVLRRTRNSRPARMFTAAEIKALLAAAKPQLKAMIYLGVNCGFGNLDCARLPIGAIDFNGGWIDFPRPKTGIARRCPLWPETIKALTEAIGKRPAPITDSSDSVFLTKYKNTWEPKSTNDDPVGKEFTKLLKELDIHRKGVGFYALRHVFQTIGEKSRDKDAVRAIMGHASDGSDMSAVYNEEPVDDQRLQAVVAYIRKWLKS
jgi:integrase